MKYMLDTNTCIFIMKHVPSVIECLEKALPSGIAISAITLAELEFGVANSVAYTKNKQALISFSTLVTTLPFDVKASAIYGEIRAELQKLGTPIGTMDMLIASHAKSAGLVLVTNNTREFSRVSGLVLEDWK